MQTYSLPEGGTVIFLDPEDSDAPVRELRDSGRTVALDTEGSGLEVYKPDFALRLVQFGDTEVSYVFEPAGREDLIRYLVTAGPCVYWNACFDTRVLDKALGIPLEETWEHAIDAAILSRLIDPRGKKDGGIGHAMKDNAVERLGLDVADARKLVMEAGRAYKLRKEADVWAKIPTTDETYRTYAGQDTILAARLYEVLLPELQELDLEEVCSLEHAVAYCVSTLIRKGWKVDRPYAEAALVKYAQEFEHEEAQLKGMQVRPTATGNYSTSRAGLIDRFTELGVRFTETTASGAPKLDDEVLQRIAAKDDEAAEIAATVLRAKVAQKTQGFIKGFLEAADPNDRVHATLNPLGTLTGRMSCSNPNLQQATREIPEVRGCFVAEPEQVLLSVDYSGVEWAVAAGVTDDANMRRVLREGGDMHGLVAHVVFGKDYTKAQRQQCKSVGLGRLYGGGVDTLARQSGLPRAKVEEAVAAIDKLYPGIRAKVREAYELIDGPTRLHLASGRHAITDAAYKALNVQCQGPARDLLAYALLRLFEAGLGENVLMLVHDEVILSVPKDEAEAYLDKVQGLMACEFLGVQIVSEGDVIGPRWKK